MNTESPESFDPNEVITVPAVNFTIVARPTTEGGVKVEIETWDPGDFKAIEHMMNIHSHRRFIGVHGRGQTPGSVFDLLLRVAVICARRVSETTGTPWTPPLWLRVLSWWRGVKARDHREA